MRAISFLRSFILLLSTSLLLTAQTDTSSISNAAVSARFSKNVELIGYVIHLGDPADNDPEHPISKIMNSAPEDREIPALYKIFELGADVPYDIMIGILHSMPEFPLPADYTLPETLLMSFGLETEAEQTKIRTLVDYAVEFHKASHFEQLWNDLAPYRKETLAGLQQNLPSTALMVGLEAFYQQGYDRYEVIPSLMIWSGPGWGLKTMDGETEVATFVLGPLEKNYDFSDKARFLNLAIHEFGHSFVNHVVLETAGTQIQETEHLFAPLQEAMAKQGYLNWETCVIEHFVRAGEVLVPESMGDHSASESLLSNYSEERQFVYLSYIVDKLRSYRYEEGLAYPEAVRRTMVDLSEDYQK